MNMYEITIEALSVKPLLERAAPWPHRRLVLDAVTSASYETRVSKLRNILCEWSFAEATKATFGPRAQERAASSCATTKTIALQLSPWRGSAAICSPLRFAHLYWEIALVFVRKQGPRRAWLGLIHESFAGLTNK